MIAVSGDKSKESVWPAARVPPGSIRKWIDLVEGLCFSGFVGLYIWSWQTTHPKTWVVFPIWLVLSFVLHRDTPKTIGWRADNLWSALKHDAGIFAIFAFTLCVTGLFLGAQHRLPAHLIEPHRFIGYFAFCLLQQVGLNSFLMNRFQSALGDSRIAALLSGAIFGALHWPNAVLAPLTAVGGATMAWLFARERNILPLALGQAILGALVWWAFPVAWHHAMRVGPGYYTFHQH